MELLEKRILESGKVYPGNILKVDSFMNHQVDVLLLQKLGKAFYNIFSDCGVTKILTLEASGIALACLTAQFFNVPMVYAKKTKTKNSSDDVYMADVVSFTRGVTAQVIVSREYLGEQDTVLIIDDFLATGSALNGMIKIVEMSGAKLVGVGVAIEKGFQGGGDAIRARGIRVEALANIDSMEDGKLVFRK